MWKIEKIVKKGDYNYAVVKNHPHATKYGYVLHHRIVMENFLGRLLSPQEIVHHNQFQGLTPELERAISENLLLEYRKYSKDNAEETETTGSVETIRTSPETVKT